MLFAAIRCMFVHRDSAISSYKTGAQTSSSSTWSWSVGAFHSEMKEQTGTDSAFCAGLAMCVCVCGRGRGEEVSVVIIMTELLWFCTCAVFEDKTSSGSPHSEQHDFKKSCLFMLGDTLGEAQYCCCLDAFLTQSKYFIFFINIFMENKHSIKKNNYRY